MSQVLKKLDYVLCNCGWVHFGISRKAAEEEVLQFNNYFCSLTEEQQVLYYGGHSNNIKTYERCFLGRCSYKDCNPCPADKVPYGSTIQPIINKED